MKQSPNDKKNYFPFTLDNGLRVLLIQNTETKKSAAALAVNVGHFNDPDERQGLAHFLEHLIFLGTQKYPDGSEYQKFISQHGGNHNAWTGTEHTSFFFDIDHHYFDQALDRFSQFFISPLLSKEFIQKERKNIDAEFKLKLKDDIRRIYDVHKETINPKHPFSKFSVGTIDTLNDRKNSNICAEITDFFNTYYRAGYMTLAIEGPQPINELKQLVENYFVTIKTSDQPFPLITQPLYLPENLSIKINIKPVKKEKKLIISFAMPSIDCFYRNKPESILIYVLGHEGKGSILSLLKQQQWAMALSAGSGINGSNFKDFNISISLTELGEAHINAIVAIVFSYLKLLKNAPLPDHYFQEKKSLAELSFLYHENSSPLDSVSQLVVNMQHYPVEDYMFGDYVMEKMDQATIDNLLTYLVSGNMRLVHISQSTDPTKIIFDQTSFWYQVPYHVEHISKLQLSKWQNTNLNEQLFLPSKNPYITNFPEVLSIEETQIQPQIIENSNGFKVWFKQDVTFKIPKGHIYVGIDSPITVENINNVAMTRLFVNIYSETVIEENYDAEVAGIQYHLYAHQGGITLQLAGVNVNQPILLTKLLTRLNHLTITAQRFDLLKKQLINHCNNSANSKSISQLFSKLSSVMQPNNPTSKELADALQFIDIQQFISFSKKLLKDISVEILIHGNWHRHHAKEISQSIKSAFNHGFDDKHRVKCPALDIKNEGEIILPTTLPEHDHACVLYYPAEDREITTIATVILLSQLLSPLFFQQMRTEKQYGYLVGVGYVPINLYPGIAFYVQSPETNALKLKTAMTTFIDTVVEELDLMDQKE